MNIKNVVEEFFCKFPELQGNFNKEIKENLIEKTDGIYTVWGLGVMPCIMDILEDCDLNHPMLVKIFAFFEEMANSDEKVRELLIYSILEKLGDEKEILQKSNNFMGSETYRLSYEVERFLGR